MPTTKMYVLILVLETISSVAHSQLISESKMIQKYFTDQQVEQLDSFTKAYKTNIFNYQSEYSQLDFWDILTLYLSDFDYLNNRESSAYYEEFMNLIKHYQDYRDQLIGILDTNLYADTFIEFENIMFTQDRVTKKMHPSDTTPVLRPNLIGAYFGFFGEYAKPIEELQDYRGWYFEHADINPRFNVTAIELFSKLDLDNELLCLIVIVQMEVWLYNLAGYHSKG